MLVVLGVLVFAVGFFAIPFTSGYARHWVGLICIMGFLLIAIGFVTGSQSIADTAAAWWEANQSNVLVRAILKRRPWLTDRVRMRQYYKIGGISLIIVALVVLMFTVTRLIG